MAQDIRIFISSPGDVTPERLIAKRVIERLAREFSYHCKIEPILWERQPLVATEHFQSKITPPRKTDIVVMIVWSRLGSPLPLKKFPGPISRGVVTGTEWEFEDAVKSYKKRNLPDLLVYRKQAPVTASLEDDAELKRQRKQKRQLAKFIRRWFVDEAEGSFKAASHSFSDPATLEDMLETHLRELIRSRIDDSASAPAGIRWHEGSPFRGLEAFEIKHAPIFFGRTRARNELRELLVRQAARGCAFVLVFGASGSGKSSLVKAGLLPDLMLPGMVERVGLCRVAMMRPSDNAEDLFAGLATALLRDMDTAQATALPELADLEYDVSSLAAQLRDADKAELPIKQGLQAAGKKAQLAEHAEARLTIVVDQLEEMFTHDDYPAADRQAFIATLTALAKSGRVWVLATMRSDFFDRLATLTELAELSEGEGRYLLTPPSDAEIGQIIGQPAREAGLRFEQREDGITLDEQLRAEASKDPSALPLLEFTLDQLWQQRTEQGMLTYEAYERLGGMEGALGRHAESVFAEQPPEVQQALPSVLRALITVGQSEQATATARTVPIANFPQGSPQRQLIEAFIHPAARLFIADGDGDGARVRVAHEALLRRWPRAVEQIETDRQDLQARARLEQSETRWEHAAEPDKPSLLLAPGLPLSEAEDLAERRRGELDPELVTYVDASSKASVAQARRRQIIRTAVTAGALLLAAIAVWFAYSANKQATEARLREQAALVKNLLATQPLEGMLLAIQTTGQSLSELGEVPPEVQSSLHSAIQVSKETNRFKGFEGWIRSVAISPDGKTIATGNAYEVINGKEVAGTVRTWDLTGNPIGGPWLEDVGDVRSVAFSRDGNTVIVGCKDGTVRLRDLEGNPKGEHLIGHRAAVTSIATSPDGKTIISGSEDCTVRSWDLEGNPIGEPLMQHGAAVNSVAFSPDGKTIVSGGKDGAVRLWDPQGNAIKSSAIKHDDSVTCVAFSSDGKTIVSGSHDETVRLWDTEGMPVAEPFRGHSEKVSCVTIIRDGMMIVSASEDGTIRLWDRKGNPIGEPLRGHDFHVMSVAISPDEKTVISGGSHYDTLRSWYVEDNPIKTPPEGHKGDVTSVTVSPDGQWIVAGGKDQTVRLRNGRGTSIEKLFPGNSSTFYSVAFSPDGETIVTGNENNAVRLWDRNGNSMGDPLIGHQAPVRSAAFSADGQTIVTGSDDGVVRLWNLEGNSIGKPLRGNKDPVTSVAISRDGKTIISQTGTSADRNMAIWLWDRQGNPIGKPFKAMEHDASSLDVSPDGQHVVGCKVFGGKDKTVRLWDWQGNLIGEPFQGHQWPVYTVAFSPDGRFIVSCGVDQTIRLWDLQGNQMGKPLRGHSDFIFSVGFSPSGQYIVSGSESELGLWPAGDWQTWLKVACIRLRNHSVLVAPESEVAKEAGKVCLTYGGWSDTQKSQFFVKQGQALAPQGTLKIVWPSSEKLVDWIPACPSPAKQTFDGWRRLKSCMKILDLGSELC